LGTLGAVTSPNHFRAHPRHATKLKATASHLDAGWTREVDMVDAGLGGISIVATDLLEALSRGDRMSVAVMTPALWDPLVVGARVAWVRDAVQDGRHEARAGLAFEFAEGSDALGWFEFLLDSGFES
jgi:hypothetical protein